MRNVRLFIFCWLTLILFVNPYGEIMSDVTLGAAVEIVGRGSQELSPHQGIDLARIDGKYYSGLGPGATILAVPVYAFFSKFISLLPSGLEIKWKDNFSLHPPHERPREVYFLQILMVWILMAPLFSLFLIQAFQYARKYLNSSDSFWVTIAMGFGSLAWVYSEMYSRQGLAGLILWNTLFWHLNSMDQRKKVSFVQGGLIAFSIAIEYQAALFSGLTLAYVLFTSGKNSAKWILAGFASVIGTLLLYHTWMYGSPLLTPYHFRAWLTEVFSVQYKGERIYSNNVLTGYFLGIWHPTWDSLWGLTFSFFKGLFFFCPIALLGVLGHVFGLSRSSGRERTLSIYVLTLFFVLLIFSASLKGEIYWSGFPSFFGPRYLVGATPMLVLGILPLLRHKMRAAIIGLILVSIFFQFLGIICQDMMEVLNIDHRFLQFPILYSVLTLISRGPRVPILDIYLVNKYVQMGVYLTWFAYFYWVFRAMKFRMPDQEKNI